MSISQNSIISQLVRISNDDLTDVQRINHVTALYFARKNQLSAEDINVLMTEIEMYSNQIIFKK